MEKIVTGCFFRYSETKNPIQIRGYLGDFHGPIGCEGDIGFYEIAIKYKEEFRKTKIRFCIKELSLLSTSEHKEGKVEAVLEKHSFLRRINLPATPVCRGDYNNNLILMTDMTENGNKIIVDKHNPLNDGDHIENVNVLKDRLINIAQTAFDNDIFLSMDAYSIAVDKKTREGKICLIDIGARSLVLQGDEYYINEHRQLLQVDRFLESCRLV